VPANCSQTGSVSIAQRFLTGGSSVAYQIVAIRENETVKCERNSVLIAIAKARVWTSEGWQVVITDEAGKALESAESDTLPAA
jgi:hypothetical protein